MKVYCSVRFSFCSSLIFPGILAEIAGGCILQRVLKMWQQRRPGRRTVLLQTRRKSSMRRVSGLRKTVSPWLVDFHMLRYLSSSTEICLSVCPSGRSYVATSIRRRGKRKWRRNDWGAKVDLNVVCCDRLVPELPSYRFQLEAEQRHVRKCLTMESRSRRYDTV